MHLCARFYTRMAGGSTISGGPGGPIREISAATPEMAAAGPRPSASGGPENSAPPVIRPLRTSVYGCKQSLTGENGEVSGLLDHVTHDFDSRMQARRGMMAQMGLRPSAEEAPRLYDELRATLLACGRCAAPEDCIARQRTAAAGAPPACRARDAFARLKAACEDLRRDDLRRCA